MKTKSKSHNGAAAKPSEKLTLKLDAGRGHLLRACAAFDGQTPEEFAEDALTAALACVAEAIGHELKQAA